MSSSTVTSFARFTIHLREAIRLRWTNWSGTRLAKKTRKLRVHGALFREAERANSFHFITYLPIGDSLFELDGLKPQPVSHGKIPAGTDWLDRATEVLQNRIATYAETEVGP
jgi:hypothetical protein